MNLIAFLPLVMLAFASVVVARSLAPRQIRAVRVERRGRSHT